MAFLDDLPKAVKSLLGGAAEALLEPAALKQLDDLVTANKGNIEEAVESLKKSGDIHPKLRELFEESAFKSLIKGNRIEVFAKFTDDFGKALDGAGKFTDEMRTDMLNKLAYDAKLAKGSEWVDLKNTRLIGGLVEKSAQDLAVREADIVVLKAQITASAIRQGENLQDPKIIDRIDAYARKAYADGSDARKAADVAEEAPTPKPKADDAGKKDVDTGKSGGGGKGGDAGDAAADAEEAARKAPSGDYAGEPSKPSILKRAFNKVSFGAFAKDENVVKAAPTPKDAQGNILAEDVKPWITKEGSSLLPNRAPKWAQNLTNPNWVANRTVGNWRAWGVSLKDPYGTAKNWLIDDMQEVWLGVPRFGQNIGERFISKPLNKFNKFMESTGAFKQGTMLESELKQLTKALKVKGTFIDGVEITPGKFGEEVDKILKKYAKNDAFRESMGLMRERLVALKMGIDEIKPVDLKADYTRPNVIDGKYGADVGLLKTNVENMHRWVDDQIETIDNFLKVNPADNTYRNQMQGEFQKILNANGGNQVDTDLRNAMNKAAFTMFDDRVGRRMGSWHAWRHYKKDLAPGKDGGFIFNDNGNPQLGGDVSKLDEKHLLLSLERGAYNEFTRISPTTSSENANMGEIIHNAMNMFEKLLDADGKTMKTWGTHAGRAQADTLLAQLKLGHRGDISACMNSDLLTLRVTSNVLEVKNGKMIGHLIDDAAGAGTDYERRSIENVIERLEYKLDGGNDFEIRDTAYKNFYEGEFDTFINTAERGQPSEWTIGTVLNPLALKKKILSLDDRSTASSQFLRGKIGSEINRAWGFVSGADIKYRGSMENIDQGGKYFNPNDFELERGWSALYKAPIRIATLPFQPLVNPDWRILNTFTQIKPTRMAMQYSGIAGTGYALWEGIGDTANYIATGLLNPDEQEDLGTFAGKLGMNALEDFTTPGAWLLSKYAVIPDFIYDKVPGALMRTAFGGRDLSENFWEKKLGIKSDGGVLPVKEAVDALFFGKGLDTPADPAKDERFWLVKKFTEGLDYAEKLGEDIHLNEKGKARLAKDEAEGITILDKAGTAAEKGKEAVLGVDEKTQTHRDLKNTFDSTQPTQEGSRENLLKELNSTFDNAGADASTNLMRHYNLMADDGVFVAGGNKILTADGHNEHEHQFLGALAS